MAKLTKSESKFYQKNYQNVILIVQKTYSELIRYADQEGIQWLRSNLNSLGRGAYARFKALHKDILN